MSTLKPDELDISNGVLSDNGQSYVAIFFNKSVPNVIF